MVNPLHLLKFRPPPVKTPKRKPVRVPTSVPSTDAMFVVLRRMRRPFIVVITTFSIATAGMMLMPGTDPNGQPYKLTLFDSFYQMVITLTTVGYTEAPHAFSYQQRMWLVISILALVVSWAYAIGSLFSVLSEPAFRDAVSAQRFRRQVRGLREQFFIIAGYGNAGRTVGLELDDRRIRFVVVEKEKTKADRAMIDPLSADVAALEGDANDPAVLGAAGLSRDSCAGVLALTDDDETNLATVMTVALLRPDIAVYARCQRRKIAARMERFGPTALINPNDRYGGYLALAAHQPVVYQLLNWLMENEQPELVEAPSGLADGRWVVYGKGQFAEEVATDLRSSGLQVERITPGDEEIDLDGVVAFVAGTDNDLTNIALAEKAKMHDDDIFLAVRQIDGMHRPLLTAMDVDSVFIPTELVAREVLARIVHPRFWTFVEEAVQRDDEWATGVRDRLVAHCEHQIPERDVITLDADLAPAVVRWLATGSLTVGDLLRHPDDREASLPLVTLLLIRDDELLVTPADDTPLAVGDHLLIAGTATGLADLSDVLFSPSTVEYVATGHHVPSTWIWRKLARSGSSRVDA